MKGRMESSIGGLSRTVRAQEMLMNKSLLDRATHIF